MSDTKQVNSDVISSTPGSTTPNKEDIVNEEHMEKPNAPARPRHGRRVSEWEALQIAAAGDYDTIDAEVAEIEADLQQMNIRSTWYKPLIRFSDPKFFTWLLVGRSFTRNLHEVR